MVGEEEVLGTARGIAESVQTGGQCKVDQQMLRKRMSENDQQPQSEGNGERDTTADSRAANARMTRIYGRSRTDWWSLREARTGGAGAVKSYRTAESAAGDSGEQPAAAQSYKQLRSTTTIKVWKHSLRHGRGTAHGMVAQRDELGQPGNPTIDEMLSSDADMGALARCFILRATFDAGGLRGEAAQRKEHPYRFPRTPHGHTTQNVLRTYRALDLVAPMPERAMPSIGADVRVPASQASAHSARRWLAHSTTPSTTRQHTPPHTAMPLPPPFPPHVLSLPSPAYRRPSPGPGGFLGGVASTAPLWYNAIPRADAIGRLSPPF
ncbi:hypothetical protein JB92DRAFT_2824806 [Gautieria morchelliformis]|nr:hypothetical protein JB92DRAFT_2824806 [Gautieria morchelliformis]